MKIAKTCPIKKKAIPWQIEFFQYIIIKPFRTFSGLCVWKDVNNEKNFARFVKKNAKIRDVKMSKPFHYH